MLAAVLADLVLVVHALFVAFAVVGGLLVARYPRVVFVHVPTLLWGTVVELWQLTCPLTPLEVALRHRAGEAGYAGSFLDEYLWPILYPPGLGADSQLILGLGLFLFNVLVYGWVWRRRRRLRVAAPD